MKKCILSDRLFLVLLVMLAVSVSVTVAAAADQEINDVVRDLPASVSSGGEFTVTLEIDGSDSAVAGIVETIPKGFTFPGDDGDITTSCNFTVDRDNRTIAFSAIGIDSIEYNVISSSSTGSYSFSGQWVDLLYQDTDLDESEERWEDTGGDKSITVKTGSSSSGGSGSVRVSSAVSEENDTAVKTMQETPSAETETQVSGSDVPDEASPQGNPADDDYTEGEDIEDPSEAPGFGALVACLSLGMAAAGAIRNKKR